ncbi:hypothetical protein OG949_41410 (plasmid) [Streptomyces scopuliridis]|uniref:hypothetical protein n=1 Tax=Streptomyces scopuliridis TaxID=452529 RepID=UPI002DDB31A5|nr:hypothetical protein [Streptomyces scopuliridis]WSB39201.1 hypothetical protein OG949_41410 [Streptomyces scopuliridis]
MTNQRGKHARRTLGAVVATTALIATPGPANAASARAAVSVDFSILQMNLCNSGKAGCYEDGRSIDEGIIRIRRTSPTVVTLNEVCRNDVARMAKETGRRGVFMAAGHRDGGLYKCKNGRNYGIGILAGRPYEHAPQVEKGWYPQQDGST